MLKSLYKEINWNRVGAIGFDLDVKEKNKIINLKNFTPLGRIKIEKKVNLNDMNRILIKKNMFTTIKFFLQNPKIKVLDIIYNPNKTVLLQMADIFFIKNLNGLIMNLMQAVFAFKLSNVSKNVNNIKKAMI